MTSPTFATRWNADLIDENYARWKENRDSVDSQWQAFFEGFELALTSAPQKRAKQSASAAPQYASSRQAAVDSLIFAYRSLGHRQATINPLDLQPTPEPRLALENFGLSEADLDIEFESPHFLDGKRTKLRDIIATLHDTYCGNVGSEYIYIQETEIRRWIQKRLEPDRFQIKLQRQQKLRILEKIFEAEGFEHFLHTRYIGQKRFSLEGGETLIPALDTIIEQGAEFGFKELVIGMAHRGRLNVLANVMGKSYEFIFREFSENYIPDTSHGDGDVKYHLGYNTVRKTESGEEIGLHLAANPSHLEAVDPVVQGIARARQRLLGDMERKQVLPVLIHGDAALAGQGIVAEVLNFSQLEGYRTGGTLHIVINNQIGFTTGPKDARSSYYCTDIAKMIEAPVFHVNGDDPYSVTMVIRLALEFRQKFKRDVFVDIVCYRKHGHNEADEPVYTQPLLYRKIAEHLPVSKILLNRMLLEGDITEKEALAMQTGFERLLEDAFQKVKTPSESVGNTPNKFAGSSGIFQPRYNFDPTPTQISQATLQRLARHLTQVPDEFTVNPKIKRQLETKWKSFENDEGVDWAFAESLAWGALLLEGTSVRLSGQDCRRGTFSHRHCVLYDANNRERYIPLLNLDKEQATFCVHNSLLSEAAVLGFDYGYSLDYPNMLCMWEAQFGDFCNGAQVIIDQFIASGESKWQRVSGLVMLLPHGYEGQGPEHSSARMERFLQLCAEDNIQVANLTTPAQYFHILRRQMKREFRKPLVIMSPKSLLRAKEAVSYQKDFTEGSFQTILDDPTPPRKASKVILCSGKVYYDLEAWRTKNKIKDTRLVRLEQLYPLDKETLSKTLKSFCREGAVTWCQEEPKNMGAWSYIAPQLAEITGFAPRFVGRKPSASPAVGSLALHRTQQQKLVEDAFQD
jgi:2-oxoglutarate dehydrogenase E1 component